MVVVLGCSTAWAQTVWNVTSPSGIHAGIAAASPGDILVVSSPTIEPFTLDKGLTIRGNNAIVANAPSQPIEVTIDVPAGQVAHVENLRFIGGTIAGYNTGTPVEAVGGTVRFENCVITAAATGAVRVIDAEVALMRCTLRGRPGIGGPGGSMSLQECEVYGLGHTGLAPGGSTACSTGGDLHAEDTLFRGGDGTGSVLLGGGGLWTSGAAFLTDCVLESGAPGGWGTSPTIWNAGGTPVALRRCQLTGPAPSGPVHPNAPLVAFEVAPTWTRGASSTLSVLGDPNALYGVWLAIESAPITHPLVVEPIWMAAAPAFAAGVLDASGNGGLTVNVPSTPGLLHLVLMCQAVSGTQLPFRSSAIAGGVVN